MKHSLNISIPALILSVGLWGAGCARDKVVLLEPKPLPDSPTVDARASALFSSDETLSKFKILVNTFQGTVMLDGVVDSEDQVEQATRLAWTIPGVRGVENNLLLRGEKRP